MPWNSGNDSGRKGIKVTDESGYEGLSQIICPIVCDGDIIGSVIIMGKDSSIPLGDADVRLASVAAAFLGKQMESQ